MCSVSKRLFIRERNWQEPRYIIYQLLRGLFNAHRILHNVTYFRANLLFSWDRRRRTLISPLVATKKVVMYIRGKIPQVTVQYINKSYVHD